MSAVAAMATLPALHTLVASELATLAERLRRVTVRIHSAAQRWDGVGAGVVWRAGARCIVVTNAHVVPPGRGDDAAIELARGRVVEAAVIARSRALDLALLGPTAMPDDCPAADVADARTLRVGEIVVALGHPFGVGGALSVGVLHAVPNGDDALIEADIRLAPGNSGGPLATLDGAVVGINAMIARGLGIAIPVHLVDGFVRENAGR